MAEFTIRSSTHDGLARVDLAGEIDLASIESIRAQIGAHLGDDGVNAIVVDLAGATFIDSSGIGALIGCRHRSVEAKKPFRVHGAVGRVAAVLDLTGVTAFLASDDA